MLCKYPHCDCPVAYPEGYKPSDASECPRCIDNEREVGTYDLVGLALVGFACAVVIGLAVWHAGE